MKVGLQICKYVQDYSVPDLYIFLVEIIIVNVHKTAFRIV